MKNNQLGLETFPLDVLRLNKRPLKTNGRLAYRGLTSLVKEATDMILKGENSLGVFMCRLDAILF